MAIGTIWQALPKSPQTRSLALSPLIVSRNSSQILEPQHWESRKTIKEDKALDRVCGYFWQGPSCSPNSLVRQSAMLTKTSHKAADETSVRPIVFSMIHESYCRYRLRFYYFRSQREFCSPLALLKIPQGFVDAFANFLGIFDIL